MKLSWFAWLSVLLLLTMNLVGQLLRIAACYAARRSAQFPRTVSGLWQ